MLRLAAEQLIQFVALSDTLWLRAGLASPHSLDTRLDAAKYASRSVMQTVLIGLETLAWTVVCLEARSLAGRCLLRYH